MKTLRMKFATDEGRTFTISLNYARDDLDAPAVETAMESFLDNEVFAEGLAGIAGADLVDRTVTPLI